MESKKLHILWTTADPLTSRNMVLMYAVNSLTHGWWEEVTVILWGAAASYAASDKTVQEHILMAQHAGVHFSACIQCAVNLGVRARLEEMGVEMQGWGEPLTELLKSRSPLLTV